MTILHSSGVSFSERKLVNNFSDNKNINSLQQHLMFCTYVIYSNHNYKRKFLIQNMQNEIDADICFLKLSQN